MGGFARDAIAIGVVKMVDAACGAAAAKMTDGNKISEEQKEGVKGLLCESMTFVTGILAKGTVSGQEVGVHLINNHLNLGKLSREQQIYCSMLIGEMALHGGKIAATAYATTIAASAGAKGGIVGGGLMGSVMAGPAGTVPGAVAGGVVGAGGPLILGSIEMYESAAALTEAAIKYHSQCGPLTMDKVEPRSTPLATPAIN